MNKYRNLFIWVLMAVMTILLFNLLSAPKKVEEEMIFSEFIAKLDSGDVEEVVIKENYVTGRLKDGKKFKTYLAEYPDLVKDLKAKGIKITAKDLRDYFASTIGMGSEEYTPLGEKERDPPLPGEVIYRDDVGVICRRWNWREGDRTKITKDTKNAIVVIESVASIPIKNAVEELEELIKKYCGGETSISYLRKPV